MSERKRYTVEEYGSLAGAIIAERDDLLAENAQLLSNCNRYVEITAALQSQLDALRADAERYQWLRDANHAQQETVGKCLKRMKFAAVESLIDGAMDAARRAHADGGDAK